MESLLVEKSMKQCWEQVWPEVEAAAAQGVSVSGSLEFVQKLMGLLRQAALNHARVLREPAPSVNLASFGADGLEFKVGFWIADPENGTDNLKSLINLDILRLLRENKIEIPYSQRVMHTRAG